MKPPHPAARLLPALITLALAWTLARATCALPLAAEAGPPPAPSFHSQGQAAIDAWWQLLAQDAKASPACPNRP